MFVAGAAGAIGRQLVPLLISRGHTVVGTTRDPKRAEWLRSAGAEPVILDIYDADADGPGTVNRERRDIRDGSTVHVVDAAWAAALAAERGVPGPYNIVDDAGTVSSRRAREALGWEPGHARPVLR